MKINQNTLITFKITKHENYFHNPSTADQYNFNLDNRGKNLLFLECFTMKDNRCEICYKACKYDDVEKYQMKSCKSDICLYES